MSIVSAIMVPHPPLIIPEIGKGEEEGIITTIEGYQQAMDVLLKTKPSTIVIISPHSTMYADYIHISPGTTAHGNFARFNARSVGFDVRYDYELVQALTQAASEAGIDGGTHGEREADLDHGTMVPLWFLKKAEEGNIKEKIVRIGLSNLSYEKHYRLGMLIRDVAERLDRRVAVIASGDLSHKLTDTGPYGYAPEGPQYDQRIMDVMSRGAFDELLAFDHDFCDRAAECGHRSFVMMAGCFDGMDVTAKKISHEGPFGVGYGICTFIPATKNEKRRFWASYERVQEDELKQRMASEDPYVRLARKSLEFYVRNRKYLSVPNDTIEALLNKRAGVFVSLKKFGHLRGCIGTIAPTTSSIAEEIIHNAVSAGLKDPRFMPVSESELADLVYSVDVLSDAEAIEDASMLDPKRYGVIVENSGRRGLLLPNLEGIDTADQQIAIAKQKAGIDEDEEVRLQRFEVVRHY